MSNLNSNFEKTSSANNQNFNTNKVVNMHSNSEKASEGDGNANLNSNGELGGPPNMNNSQAPGSNPTQASQLDQGSFMETAKSQLQTTSALSAPSLTTTSSLPMSSLQLPISSSGPLLSSASVPTSQQIPHLTSNDSFMTVNSQNLMGSGGSGPALSSILSSQPITTAATQNQAQASAQSAQLHSQILPPQPQLSNTLDSQSGQPHTTSATQQWMRPSQNGMLMGTQPLTSHLQTTSGLSGDPTQGSTQLPSLSGGTNMVPSYSQHFSNRPLGLSLGGNITSQQQPQQLNNPAQQQNHGNPQQLSAANQQQHTSFAGTKFPLKPWHNPHEHKPIRVNMVEEIIKLLKTRRPNATEDWHEKLPHMARRLEDALYLDAATLDDYKDLNSLKLRLQQLALSMGGNKSMKHNGMVDPRQQQQQQMLRQKQGMPQQPGQPTGTMNLQQQQFQQQQQQIQHYSAQQQQQSQQQYGNPSYNQQLTRTAQAVASQYPQMSQPIQGQGINMGNTMPSSTPAFYQYQPNLAGQSGQPQTQGMGTNGQQQFQQPQQQGMQFNQNTAGGNDGQQMMMMNNMMNQQPNPSGSTLPSQPMLNATQQQNNFMMTGTHQPNSSGMMNSQMVQLPNGQQMMAGQAPGQSGIPMLANGQMSTIPGGVPSSNQSQSSSQGHTEEHRKQVLKQQQQRLLLLRHASKCPHESGRCPVTPHCWSMKQLWKHIMSCKDQECKVAHCVSSRYVLSHYSKCKEQTCPVCGPVREAIKRNFERSRDVVKMARLPGGGPGSIPQIAGMQQGLVRGQGLSIGHQPPFRDDGPASKRQRKDKGKGGDKMQMMQPQPTLVIPNRKSQPKRVYPLDPISCAIYSFSSENIQSHFKTIHEGLRLTVAKIKELCKPILDDLFKIPHAYGVFGSPVDPVMLGLPDYFDVVKQPMDLGTVSKKLDGGSYRDMHNFVSDVHLTFDNAMLYNPKNSDVFALAKSLKKEFDLKFRQRVSDFERMIEIMRSNPDCCLICGEISLKFEPPVYYCNGTCAQRIRRNNVFYSNNTNTYHWCSPCFTSLKDTDTIRLPDCNITKAELSLNKKKHTEESEEGWVQCEGGCERWVHQVCSLFNARRNVGDDVSYVCPICIQEKRRRSPDEIIIAPTSKKMKAQDLPVTVLSQFLEKRIYQRLAIAYRDNAAKLGVSEGEVEKCPPLFLRQVSCMDKMQTVREGVYNRYKDRGYPEDFPCRTKCVVLFQNIDGQDVILFGMYVYEYGHKCPQPNQRRVYVSYLDSVHYLRPKQYRTMVYHEILISYLDYVKARGFHTAHIWACPPQKGDDYILYVHPADQKTPKPQILRVWYDEMLKRCMERGIVLESTDIHTEYLLDPSNDATVLPYFEGDYWVNEAEVIIKNLNEGKGKAVLEDDYDTLDPELGNKSKRKSKNKRMPRTSMKPVLLAKGARDPVMAKMANIIEPMKDTFFVARLHPREKAQQWAEQRKQEMAADTATAETKDKLLQEEALSGGDLISNSKGKSQAENNEQQTVPTSGMVPVVPENPFLSQQSSNPMDSSQGFNTSGTGGPMDVAQTSVSEHPPVKLEVAPSTGITNPFGPSTTTYTEQGSNENKNGDPRQTPMAEKGPQNPQPGDINTTMIKQENDPSHVGKNPPSTLGTDGDAEVQHVPDANAIKIDLSNTPTDEGNATVVKTEGSVEEAKSAAPVDPINVVKAEGDVRPPISTEIDGKSTTDPFKNETNELVSSPLAPTSKFDPSSGNGALAPASTTAGTIGLKTPFGGKQMGMISAPVGCIIPCGDGIPPQLSDDTEDVDDQQESEHFETRQSFLNLCQGNHYQYDQLRRAKHSSMMVLYHLHNPDAPKFVPSCSKCHSDILVGYRYHCDTCEVDLCQSCYTSVGPRIHMHPLRPISVAASAPTQVTEQQRRERQRSIQLHMQLLQHAVKCVKCDSRNCARMKDFLKHDAACTVKVAGGCRLCARVTNLLNIHARSCRIENCTVPHCLEMREQIRKLTLRQQQMDDRRRKKMNSEYGRGGGNDLKSN